MNFAIEPVMGAINTALNNGLTGMGGSSKLVLGLILGGMMAIDMGGPFNKARRHMCSVQPQSQQEIMISWQLL